MAGIFVPWKPDSRLLPRNYLRVTADFSSATWNTVATHEILTVTGLVRLVLIPECTEDLTSSGGGTLTLGIAGALTAFIGSTTATAVDAGELWLGTTPAAQFAWSSVIDRVIKDADVGYEIGTAVTQDGTIVFHCWWEPLNDGTANVVQGAGGTT